MFSIELSIWRERGGDKKIGRNKERKERKIPDSMIIILTVFAFSFSFFKCLWKFTLKHDTEYIYISHTAIAFIFRLTRNPPVPNLNSTGKIKGNFLDVIYTIRSPLSGRSIPFPGASGKRHYGKFGTWHFLFRQNPLPSVRP